MLRFITAYTLMIAAFAMVQQRLLILVSTVSVLLGIALGLLRSLLDDPDRRQVHLNLSGFHPTPQPA
jgi:hypothetical protein